MHIVPGSTVVIPAEFAPSLHGAMFDSGDERVALVGGRLPIGARHADITITGIRTGSAPIVGSFPQGFSVWLIEVGRVVVSDVPCVPPTVTLPLQRVRASPSQPVTISANVTATPPVTVEWLELLGPGYETILASGENPLTLYHSGREIRTIVARATNACGSATSEAAIIEPPTGRRRPVKR